MVDSKLDAEMFVAIPLFTIGAAATLGLISTDIIPFVNLGDVLLNTGGIEWTLGRGLSLAALAYVFINRDVSIKDTGGVDAWVLYATVGLVVAPPFVGALETTLAGTFAGFIAFLTQTMGITIISYLN
jgi:hypothetical protein